MKRILAIVLMTVTLALSIPCFSAYAATTQKIQSDTPLTLSIEQRKSYTFKFTVPNTTTASFSTGNSAILQLQSCKRVGTFYYVTIKAGETETGSTGIYGCLQGQTPSTLCVVTVTPEPIEFGYRGSTYLCNTQAETDKVRKFAKNVPNMESYGSYESQIASQSKEEFEKNSLLPCTENARKADLVRNTADAVFFTQVDSGNDYQEAYSVGGSTVLEQAKDCAIMEAALHTAGFDCTIVWGTTGEKKDGVPIVDIWNRVKIDNQWYDFSYFGPYYKVTDKSKFNFRTVVGEDYNYHGWEY